MIKKLLSFVLVLVMITLLYVCIFKGVVFTDEIKILSYKQLQDEEMQFETNVEVYEKLVNEDYQLALTKLENAKNDFETAKKKYEELKQMGSYEQLLELTKDKEYQLEFLWVKLDLIARNNNLEAQFELENISGNAKNIKVELAGDYLSVKNYIYDILIDLDLNFKAEEIVILPSGQGVTATFKIKNVNILM